ncbi:MAG TPA: NlpC/P60 family protein [Afifellaceae bacterium]|nr:NlpC/P60 family protein [Afifellaceae bacterium]
MNKLDRRIHAYRPDLADARLEGQVEAERFVTGTPARIVAPKSGLFRHPSPDAPLDTEALRGDPVNILEKAEEGWNWVQLGQDDYVGWMPANDMVAGAPEPTHRVCVPSTFVFCAPDIKSRPLESLSLGSGVTAIGEARDHNAHYAKIEPAGAIVLQHLVPADHMADDFVTVAETLTGTPYYWAGNSAFGIDCSALVQLALRMAGHRAPRDSDMQEALLGTALDIAAGIPPLRRGDLVFWKGHVGIMQDGERLLHANAHHMAVASEPLTEAISRLAAAGCPVTAIRRL